MLPLSARTSLGTGDCDWRGWSELAGIRRLQAQTRAAAPRSVSTGRLAASATWQLVPRQPLGLRARRPPHAQRAGGEWSGHGAARTGLARRPTLPLMAAMMPLTLCAPGLSTCQPGVPCQISCSPVRLYPSQLARASPDQMALCEEDRTDTGSWRLFWGRGEGLEEKVEALLKTEEEWHWLGVTALGR